MFDIIYFHAVMLVRYVMSLIKATYLLTYLLIALFPLPFFPILFFLTFLRKGLIVRKLYECSNSTVKV
jgi:hypothetical protein